MSKEFPIEKYDNRGFIGKGSFGSIYKHQLKQNVFKSRHPEFVAVKLLPISVDNVTSSDRNEFLILQELEHDNIVKMLGICEMLGQIGLAMEFCQGDLHGFIIAKNRQLDVDEVAFLINELCQGVGLPAWQRNHTSGYQMQECLASNQKVAL